MRGGEDLPGVIGHASIVDRRSTEAALELTLACCRDLLTRLGLGRQDVRWVLPLGGGANTGGLHAALERGLGIACAASTSRSSR